MRMLFADTFYWIALLNPRDTWHQRVKAFNTLTQPHLVTTDEVLIEFLNFFSSSDLKIRQGTVQRVEIFCKTGMFM